MIWLQGNGIWIPKKKGFWVLKKGSCSQGFGSREESPGSGKNEIWIQGRVGKMGFGSWEKWEKGDLDPGKNGIWIPGNQMWKRKELDPKKGLWILKKLKFLDPTKMGKTGVGSWEKWDLDPRKSDLESWKKKGLGSQKNTLDPRKKILDARKRRNFDPKKKIWDGIVHMIPVQTSVPIIPGLEILGIIPGDFWDNSQRFWDNSQKFGIFSG